jgi:hypothetical protein
MTSGVTPGPGGREKSGRREACLIGERLDYATGTIFAITIPLSKISGEYTTLGFGFSGIQTSGPGRTGRNTEGAVAIQISGKDQSDESVRVLLLQDINTIFRNQRVRQIASEDCNELAVR